MRIVIVTGLSGAGKSTALRALEDVGFYCADNVPLPLLGALVDALAGVGVTSAALVVDARQEPFLADYRAQVAGLRAAGHRVEVLFLKAADEVLIRRFSETRRRHPLAGDDLRSGIRRDRELLAPLRADARNATVRTDALNVHQLKGIIQERYGRREGQLAITLLSFGFKHGLPPEADLVWDVRFLPNPYFIEGLSQKDGTAADVAAFVLDSDAGRELIDRLEQFARFALPEFEREGKMYLTIAVGCTGGRHRSVAVVEELGRRLGGDWDVVVRHRDLDRG
ncbi:MAG: RNase adapter RapZ [Deltaproteobacteria bacterium]|nr:MAG: RNase adapter RapZ [Deltaproteobacteria bacterium]